MIIICDVHGSFLQKPMSHIKHGCKKCGRLVAGLKCRIGKKEFIKRANGQHGKDSFDYSKVEYITGDKKVIIGCFIHGDFKQAPFNHIEGQGCPTCNKPGINEKLLLKTLEKSYTLNLDFFFDYKISDINSLEKRKLRMDFYFPALNKAIELDGGQHHNEYAFSSKRKDPSKELKIRKQNDKYKDDFCKNNNIALIRIDGIKFVKKKLVDHIHKVILPWLKNK